jgi:hypothetical protein
MGKADAGTGSGAGEAKNQVGSVPSRGIVQPSARRMVKN